jgi:hypothetical protein
LQIIQVSNLKGILKVSDPEIFQFRIIILEQALFWKTGSLYFKKPEVSESFNALGLLARDL